MNIEIPCEFCSNGKVGISNEWDYSLEYVKCDYCDGTTKRLVTKEYLKSRIKRMRDSMKTIRQNIKILEGYLK